MILEITESNLENPLRGVHTYFRNRHEHFRILFFMKAKVGNFEHVRSNDYVWLSI
jgi:hypothetical protein